MLPATVHLLLSDVAHTVDSTAIFRLPNPPPHPRSFAYTWQKSGATADTVPTVRAITPEAAPHKIPRKLGKGLYRRVETQPGLDAFLDDPKGLQSKALGPLLDWAYAVVPASEAAATPVFLLATGGVRRLPPADRDRLLEGARGVLAASKFRWGYASDQINAACAYRVDDLKESFYCRYH